MLIAILTIDKIEIYQINIFFFLDGDLDKKVYMENLRGLLLKAKTKNSINLSSHYMICNKHLNHDMKNLIKLCFQMSLKSTTLINIFI